MKKIVLAALSCAALLAFASCSKENKIQKGEFTQEAGKLKIAMEVGYPPFEYYAEDGKTPAGFDVELGKEIAKRLGLNAEFLDVAWDGIFAGLTTDRYDVVMSAATITPERLAAYDFSQAYIGNGQALILKKDSSLPWNKPEDAAGKKIGYQAETTSDFYIEKYAAAHNFEFVPCEYDKVMNAYDDLKFGRIDCVISDNLVSVSYLNVPNSEFKRVWTGEPDEYFGVCMKKGNKVLQDKINKAIDDMKADGTMAKIYIQIFGEDLSSSIK
ncbi:MAG: amino acid ABC transporter substrate-binding protein [Treponema sp.]|nr:amino acid ABC transporter substrate-binding protein [Candidatus Treponema equifaecale]